MLPLYLLPNALIFFFLLCLAQIRSFPNASLAFPFCFLHSSSQKSYQTPQKAKSPRDRETILSISNPNETRDGPLMASKFGLAGGIPERRVRHVWDAIDSRQFKNALKLSTTLLAKYPNSPYALVRSFPLRLFSLSEDIFLSTSNHIEAFLAFVNIFLSCIFSRTKRSLMEYKKLLYLRGVQLFMHFGWS